MTDACYFNQEDYCIFDAAYIHLESCQYKDKQGLCQVSEDVLITEEEYHVQKA